jgi:CubicO group peptidase (beta-lactamase class C family)
MKKFTYHVFILKASVFSLALNANIADLQPVIDGKIEAFMEALNVPGAAVGILLHGEEFSKGYGFRNIEHILPTTPHTIFPVGSLSKSFSTFLIGQLVDEGIVDFDDPISERIPYFKLENPVTTYEITLRDYLTHISGYPKHDAAWFGKGYDRAQMVERLRFLPPIYPMRTHFLYQTGMGYMVAGHAVECATEKTWEELSASYIFDPLGMNRTHFSISKLTKDEDHASGYRESNKEIIPMKYMDVFCINPGGGVNSCVDDLMRFLKVLLKKGEGYISLQAFEEITSPQVITDSIKGNRVGLENEITMETYGLGWFIITYKGEHLIFHGGNIGGFSSVLMFFPKRDLGIVVLSNKDHTPFPYIVASTIADILLDIPQTDWLKKMAQFSEYDKNDLQQHQKATEGARHRNTEPSHPLHEYQGVYTHPGYGEVVVQMKDNALEVELNGSSVNLAHWHYDVFEFTKNNDLYFLEGLKLSFQENFHGDIHSLLIPFEPKIGEICFMKEKDRLLFSENYLDRFVGDYNWNGFNFIITRQGNQLTVSALGQPPFLLESERDGLFKVLGHEGNSVQFLADEEKNITAVQLIRPDNSTFTAHRN